MTVVCPICGKKLKEQRALGPHKLWKHNPKKAGKLRQKLSRMHKERLSILSKDEQLERLKKSALSVPRWNAGRQLPKEMRIKISKGVRKAFYGKDLSRAEKKEISCDQCGKKIEKSITQIHDFNFCSRECYFRFLSKPSSPLRSKISASVKDLYRNPEYKKRYMSGREKMRRSFKWRKNVSDGVKRWFKENPEDSNKLIQKMRLACKVKPNRKEVFLNKLLEQYLPNTFKYVGDGQIFIACRNPDWISKNGKKLIIELFGDYWHNISEVEEIRRHYIKHGGWKTLVVWEHELETPSEVIGKIRSFVENA